MIQILIAVVVLAILISASVSDVRTRHVSDLNWVVMCTVCIPLSAIWLSQDYGFTVALLYLVGCTSLATYMLSEWAVGPYAIPFIALSVSALFAPLLLGLSGAIQVAMIPVMFALLLASNRVGLMPGGADVKCLMTLAMVFPVFPDLPTIWHPFGPTDPVFNPTVTVLFIALLLTLVEIPRCLMRNLRSGYRGAGMFSSYVVRVEDLDPIREWPTAWVEDGIRIHRRMGDRPVTREVLMGKGVVEVRVSAALPFILPITVAFTLVILVLGLIL